MTKLRLSAKRCPRCMSCGLENPDGNMLCLAHSNQQKHGKGMGKKSEDKYGAIVCDRCHKQIDANKPNREQAQDMHCTAHIKTLAWWRKEGYL